MQRRQSGDGKEMGGGVGCCPARIGIGVGIYVLGMLLRRATLGCSPCCCAGIECCLVVRRCRRERIKIMMMRWMLVDGG